MMEKFYTDDRTGKFSDTTLRTWLLFGLFFFFSLALCVLVILHLSGALPPGEVQYEPALDLLGILGMTTFGGGALYLGKRVNESRRQPGRDLPGRNDRGPVPGKSGEIYTEEDINGI